MNKAITNPVKAIQAYCLNCVGNQKQEVILCPSKDCNLYPFRLGTNPYRKKKELSESSKLNLKGNFSK